jgi:hypothetical protein
MNWLIIQTDGTLTIKYWVLPQSPGNCTNKKRRRRCRVCQTCRTHCCQAIPQWPDFRKRSTSTNGQRFLLLTGTAFEREFRPSPGSSRVCLRAKLACLRVNKMGELSTHNCRPRDSGTRCTHADKTRIYRHVPGRDRSSHSKFTQVRKFTLFRFFRWDRLALSALASR